MTKTYSLSTLQIATVTFLFVMIALLAFALPASADTSAGKSGGNTNTGNNVYRELEPGCYKEATPKGGLRTVCNKDVPVQTLDNPRCWREATPKGGLHTVCDKPPLQVVQIHLMAETSRVSYQKIG